MKYFFTKLDNEKKYLNKFSEKIYNSGLQSPSRSDACVSRPTWMHGSLVTVDMHGSGWSSHHG